MNIVLLCDLNIMYQNLFLLLNKISFWYGWTPLANTHTHLWLPALRYIIYNPHWMEKIWGKGIYKIQFVMRLDSWCISTGSKLVAYFYPFREKQWHAWVKCWVLLTFSLTRHFILHTIQPNINVCISVGIIHTIVVI